MKQFRCVVPRLAINYRINQNILVLRKAWTSGAVDESSQAFGTIVIDTYKNAPTPLALATAAQSPWDQSYQFVIISRNRLKSTMAKYDTINELLLSCWEGVKYSWQRVLLRCFKIHFMIIFYIAFCFNFKKNLKPFKARLTFVKTWVLINQNPEKFLLNLLS